MDDTIFIERINVTAKLVDNKLYLTVLDKNFNNEDYLKILQSLELFFNISQKNNNKFYLIIDISKTAMFKIKNIFNYIYKCTIFFKKHHHFIQEYLYGTVIIMENKINKKIFENFLKFYQPIRPYKFIKNDNNITDINNILSEFKF